MGVAPIGHIDRRELLTKLFPDQLDWLFISGLAGASKDTAALTSDGANSLTMAGTMGAAVPMGLGLALSAPKHKVAVITGDGEMLMGIGALVTVAAAKPPNLSIVCIDNAMHGETGGQRGHTGRTSNLKTIAEGAGIESTKVICDPQDIPAAAEFLSAISGPRFLLCRVLESAPSAHKRNMDLTECRLRFRRAFSS